MNFSSSSTHPFLWILLWQLSQQLQSHSSHSALFQLKNHTLDSRFHSPTCPPTPPPPPYNFQGVTADQWICYSATAPNVGRVATDLMESKPDRAGVLLGLVLIWKPIQLLADTPPSWTHKTWLRQLAHNESERNSYPQGAKNKTRHTTVTYSCYFENGLLLFLRMKESLHCLQSLKRKRKRRKNRQESSRESPTGTTRDVPKKAGAFNDGPISHRTGGTSQDGSHTGCAQVDRAEHLLELFCIPK